MAADESNTAATAITGAHCPMEIPERRKTERRKSARTVIKDEKVKVSYGDGLTGYARLVNLSPKGVSLATMQALAVSSEISIQTALTEQPFNGRVIWCKSNTAPSDGFEYLCGVSFGGTMDPWQMFSLKAEKNPLLDGRRTMKPLFEKSDKFAIRLDEWKKDSVYVYFRVPKTAKNVVIFSSNDFLCLSRHPKVIAASAKALRKYGIGSGAASILAGSTPIHSELQERLAAFKGAEAVLVTASGYVANVGSIAGFADGRHILIIDEKSHASMFHACKESESEMRVFRHNDVKDLLNKIARYPLGVPKMILTEGLFSMDGDLGKLREIHAIARRYNASVFLDDGHSVGLFGEHGRGGDELAGLLGKCDLVTGSFSKAFGAMGGFVASTRKNIEYLRHFSHPFMFTSALPASVCAGILAALDVMEREPERRRQITKNGHFFRESLRDMGFNISMCDTHLVPIVVGHEVKAYQLAKRLEDEGIIANAVARPAVPRGGARVRFGVRYAHSQKDLERTLEILQKLKRSLEL
jgi:8-amino-7-oxononanoate synthase